MGEVYITHFHPGKTCESSLYKPPISSIPMSTFKHWYILKDGRLQSISRSCDNGGRIEESKEASIRALQSTLCFSTCEHIIQTHLKLSQNGGSIIGYQEFL